MRRQERAQKILERLRQDHPRPECALHHRNAFELLVATILSAQCTDERVNQVTPKLFQRFPDAERMAGSDTAEVEELIKPTGFFRNKTRSLIGAAHRLVEEFRGEVPRTMEELLTLPGVARKTANVILGTAYGINEGMVVDTHVRRLSNRMGLTRQDDPVKIEQDLMKLFPREEWTDMGHRLILHGRQVCNARLPACGRCSLGPDVCPSWDPVPEHWTGRGRAEVKGKAAEKKTAHGKKDTKKDGKKAAVRRKGTADKQRTTAGYRRAGGKKQASRRRS